MPDHTSPAQAFRAATGCVMKYRCLPPARQQRGVSIRYRHDTAALAGAPDECDETRQIRVTLSPIGRHIQQMPRTRSVLSRVRCFFFFFFFFFFLPRAAATQSTPVGLPAESWQMLEQHHVTIPTADVGLFTGRCCGVMAPTLSASADGCPPPDTAINRRYVTANGTRRHSYASAPSMASVMNESQSRTSAVF